MSKEKKIQHVLKKLDRSTLVERKSFKIVANNILDSKKVLVQVHLDVKNHRENFLQQKLDKKETKKYETCKVSMSVNFYWKSNRNAFNNKKFKTTKSQSNMTYIDVPKDILVDRNRIPKKLSQEEWNRIEDTELIEKYIIEINRRYLN